MTYIIRNANSMTLPLTAGFDTLEDAQHALASLEIIEGENPAGAIRFTIETLESYGNAAQHHFKASSRLATDLADLRDAVTKHLDAVEGAMDEEEFIAEHEELAEAIGYEFNETEDIEVRLTVSVTKKRGQDIDEDDLDIQVDASYGNFVVNDTAWEVR